jgi:ribosome biogenesis protein BRX1
MPKKKGTKVVAVEAADEVDAPVAGPSAKEDTADYPSVVRKTTHVKKKVMVLCSRGVTSAYMELMEDVMKLLPHHRKDPKFDKKEPLTSLVDIAELGGCKLVLYFEARKMKDLYMWAGHVGDAGPSAKFLVQQIRPMRDLRLTGNCLLGSRPILSFDGSFSATPHLQLVRRLLTGLFAPPKGHPRYAGARSCERPSHLSSSSPLRLRAPCPPTAHIDRRMPSPPPHTARSLFTTTSSHSAR